MATFTKEILSGSTNGRPILISGTNTASANVLQTGSATATVYDEIWLYAMNTDTTTRKLTIEWGGVTAPDDLIEINVLAESGLLLVVPGLIIKGNATPLVVRAFASVTNVLTVLGYVNRIS